LNRFAVAGRGRRYWNQEVGSGEDGEAGKAEEGGGSRERGAPARSG
jgi:hypothetical protein